MEKLLIQGMILAAVLTAIQMGLENAHGWFMSYMPPIGFVLLLFTTYLLQPIMVGVLNIFLINLLYKTKGWQVGFWLNGIFLLLAFSTINLVLQINLSLPFAYIATIDIIALSIPFGCIARFSNGGWKKPIE
ncbi:MAG: hypothetical protein NWE98_07235 [Candidatus Bathyarchaeota archaeon]|nr:hypothetical protein [Candidatus Bathyarchaeota archaeon]